MPRAIDPSYRFAVVLDSDKDKPDPPTFWFRAATAREWRRLFEPDEIASLPDKLEKMAGVLAETLVKWRLTDATGAEIPFDATRLLDVLGPMELSELFGKVVQQGQLAGAEKKASDSPPSSNGDNSAATAPANASTSPAIASPP